MERTYTASWPLRLQTRSPLTIPGLWVSSLLLLSADWARCGQRPRAAGRSVLQCSQPANMHPGKRRSAISAGRKGARGVRVALAGCAPDLAQSEQVARMAASREELVEHHDALAAGLAKRMSQAKAVARAEGREFDAEKWATGRSSTAVYKFGAPYYVSVARTGSWGRRQPPARAGRTRRRPPASASSRLCPTICLAARGAPHPKRPHPAPCPLSSTRVAAYRCGRPHHGPGPGWNERVRRFPHGRVGLGRRCSRLHVR